MNWTIYEIKATLADLFKELEHTTDPELRASLWDKIAEVQESEDDKKLAWVCYLKNRTSLAEAIGIEAERLRAKEAEIMEGVKRDEEYLSRFINIDEKWSRGAHEMGWRTCPPSAEPVEENKIPAQYMREKIMYTPDRQLALKDFKAGVKEIPGFKYVTGKKKFYVK